MIRPVLLLFACTLPRQARAATILVRRDGGTSVATWVPILVVVIAISLAAAASIVQRRRHGQALATALARPTNPQTREVTAEQLAGRTATAAATTSNTANNGNGANPPRTRRPRRTRRTPSQISTKSLPAYMADAGDQELVIYRAPTNDANEMNTLDEDDSPRPSMDITSPLMAEHNNASPSILPEISRTSTHMTRPSVDTIGGGSDESSTSLLRNQQPDPRGEAPPYTEISLNDEPQQTPQRRISTIRRILGGSGSNSNSPTNTREPTLPATAPAQTTAPGHRPSVSISSTLPAASDSGHTRGASSGTTASALSRIGSRPTHRPSHSGGSSFFQRSLHHLRPASPPPRASTSSDNRLLQASPSLISLNSISAPLSHTLTRTEIQFPAGGPTPEQMKLLSSRESLGRFGVPYGEEAVKFSRSRVDVAGLPPPPEFESVIGDQENEEGLPRVASDSPISPALGENTGPEASANALTSASDGPTADASPDISPDSSFSVSTTADDQVEVPVVTSSPPLPSTTIPSIVTPPTSFRGRPSSPNRADSVRSHASFVTATGESRRMSIASANSFATAQESVADGPEVLTVPGVVIDGPTPIGSPEGSDGEGDETETEGDVAPVALGESGGTVSSQSKVPRSASPVPLSTSQNEASGTTSTSAPVVVSASAA